MLDPDPYWINPDPQPWIFNPFNCPAPTPCTPPTRMPTAAVYRYYMGPRAYVRTHVGPPRRLGRCIWPKMVWDGPVGSNPLGGVWGDQTPCLFIRNWSLVTSFQLYFPQYPVLRIRDVFSQIWQYSSRIQTFFIPDPGSYMKSGMQTYSFLASYAFRGKVLVLVKKIRDPGKNFPWSGSWIQG
jgi:hypothetical protein